ncbi:MAG: hypothetical protein VB096_06045 [Pseudoflavonifractor sp.]|nr:hypothetical protein [Pseudoflavonifractor sp.]
MSKRRDDDELNQDGGYSLEEILAEFGSGKDRPESGEEAPPVVEDQSKPERRDWREDTIPFPVHPRQPDISPAGSPLGAVTTFPGPAQDTGGEELAPLSNGERVSVLPKEEQPTPEPDGEMGESVSDETKVLEFPTVQPDNLVTAGIDKLRRKADEFAGHMYEEEGIEDDEGLRRAEELIPGVDEEEESPAPGRKPRRTLPPAPDIPPADLARRYTKGLKSMRFRTTLLFFLLFPLLYLTLAEAFPLPIPTPLAASGVLRCYTLAAFQAAAMILGADALIKGLARPFQFRMGMDTLAALANVAVFADALTLPALTGGELHRQPFCLAAVLTLWCAALGNFYKRRGQRMACRTAASASEPYLVTRDEGKWNGRDTYVKWSGPVVGFGSQVQGEDGAERVYRTAAPLLLLACVLFSLISSLGRNRPQDILWCLSATLSASASLSATLCFGLPWRKLSTRLAKSGAALAGWEGVVNTTGTSNILLTDGDLFPPGAVSLNGVKVYGEFSVEKVVADTATVLRDGGCGQEKVFRDLLRAQGGTYRRGEDFTAYEGGGFSETIRGQQVLVGSAAFMTLMEVALPPGLNVKNAAFCAIDGDLAGIFALNYHLPGAVPEALDALIRNHIAPVLATRDFNLIPSMLRQRFKLPVERMEFPSVERRRELSEPDQEHSDTLAAVLCREGVGPYSEAVVGGRRLRAAVRLSAVLTCLGSLAGALLAFYLTFIAAYDSLTPVNLTVFLIMWLVPTLLISGWVNQY